jgi:hypothetical protein
MGSLQRKLREEGVKTGFSMVGLRCAVRVLRAGVVSVYEWLRGYITVAAHDA